MSENQEFEVLSAGMPECEIRVGSKRMRARARTASGGELFVGKNRLREVEQEIGAQKRR